MSNKILDELIAARVPSDTILAVAKMIAQLEVNAKLELDLEAKRAKNAERMRTVRARARTCKHVQTPPRAYTTPLKIDSKKNLSIPDDFSPDLEFAKARGWSMEYAISEAQRFRDHALSKGRRARDWSAAWRSWVTSPYQKPTNGATNGHDRGAETLSQRCERLAGQARELEDAAELFPTDDAIRSHPGG